VKRKVGKGVKRSEEKRREAVSKISGKSIVFGCRKYENK
jgi:hypothetical protein